MMPTGRLLSAVCLGLALILGLLGPLSYWSVSPAQAHEAQNGHGVFSLSSIPQAQSGTGVVRVALTGTDAAGCGSTAAPCKTVQFAVDEALPGEEIHIAAGTYSGVILRAGTNQHVHTNKRLTLRGGYTVTNWTVSDPVANPTILDAQGGGRVIRAQAPITVENLSLVNGRFDDGGGLVTDFDLTMTNVNVLSNTALTGNGGGVAASNGQVIITGGRFENNQADDNGGGLDVSSGMVTVSGTRFISNTAVQGHGGGIGSGVPLTLINAYFERNRAETDGGGAVTFNNLNVVDTQFISNTAGHLGGGFAANTLTMSNVQLLNNTATDIGGGGYANSTATVQGGLIQSNRTTSSAGGTGGGGLWAQGTLSLSGTQFLSNTAGRNGGGLNLNNVSVITNALFQDNLAVTAGGGIISINVPTTTLANVQFISNTALTGNGGGVAAGNGQVIITGGRFENNQAQADGGGLDSFSGMVTVSGTRFISNTAVQGHGGGIGASDSIQLTNAYFERNRAETDGGGAVTFNNLNVVDTQFISNTAGHLGGGFAANTLTMSNVQLLNNTATDIGGGGYANSTATVQGGLVQSNRTNSSAVGNGGAGLWIQGTLSLSGTRFLSNTAGRNGGGLNLNNVSVITNALFQDNLAVTAGGGIIANTSAASTTLVNVQFISNTAQTNVGGGFAAGFSPVTATNSLFERNRAGLNGGGLSATGLVILNEVEFIDNTSGNRGGGAYATGNSLVNGGRFENNQAAFFGGGLLADGTLTLTDTQFISNQSGNSGAGALAIGFARLNGGLFQNNISTGGGSGGFYAFNGAVLTNTQFLSNTAANGGAGGLFVQNGLGTLIGGLFQNNRSLTHLGGAVQASNLLVTGTQFISNAAVRGGALDVTGNLTVTSAQFLRNRSDTYGGAIWVSSIVDLTDVNFLTNTATFSSGGAVHANGAITVTGGTFQGNVAGESGGGLNAGALATLSGIEFVNNAAGTQGGAIYFSNGGNLADLTLDQNTAEAGGGLYLQSGTLSQSGGVITLTNNLANDLGGGGYINGGTLTLDNARILTNTATTNGGGLYQAGGATSVTNSCIVANSDIAANHNAGAAITATGNWWGAANGPSGAAPGGGDSVSANVDFSGFLAVPIAGCPNALETDLRIAKVINSPLASPGDPVTYTLIFTNSGPGMAKNILITDVIPVSITRTSLNFSSNVTITPTGSISYAWQVANLGAGQSGQITISGVLSDPLVLGAFTNTTIITTSTVDPNTANNTSSVKLTIIDPLVFVVNVTGDGVDTNPGDGLCEAAPDECSLRAALMEANASSAVSTTIRFNIPGAGVQTITPATPLPTITHPVLIDGLSQPQASCAAWPPTLLIELQGPPVPVFGMSGLVISGTNNVTVQGLVINQFESGSGIAISGGVGTGNNHRIECNFLGTNSAGNESTPNALGLGLLNVNNSVISGNLISGNTPQSGLILVGSGLNATGNTIRNNRIGTNAEGTTAIENERDGILILNAKNNLVTNNLISGNHDDGIDITDFTGIHPDVGLVASCQGSPCSANNTIENNQIGTDVNGQVGDMGNAGEGIQIEDAQNNLIRNNSIAGNGGNGILVKDQNTASCTKGTNPCGFQNRIISNTIFSNVALGIDLAQGQDADGVTDNDAGDGDSGPNLRQNFPALTLAVLNGGNLEISGALDSGTGPFTLQFFANNSCDPTNHGEGETLLGTRTLAAAGPFNATFPAPAGEFIVATATDASGNTSEFSACIQTTPPADLRLTKNVIPGSALPGQTITYTLTFSNAGPAFASHVLITDIIPASLTNVNVTIDSDRPVIDTGASPAYVWSIEGLQSGQGGVITITGEISPALGAGIITNSATITSETIDIIPANNNDTAVVVVGIPPALTLRKTAIPTNNVPYHGLVTYTLTISNSGGTTANGVVLTDTLPLSTTFATWVTRPAGAANTAGQVTWSGTVTANTAITLIFVVSHTGNYGEVVTNTAQYTYGNTSGSSNGATFSVEAAIPIEPIYLPLILKIQAPFEGP